MPRGKHLASKTPNGRASKTRLGLILGVLLTLAVPAAALSATIGNAPTDRAHVDSWTDFKVVDKNNPAPFDGYFTKITYYAERAGDSIQFFVVDSNDEVTWVSDSITVAADGQHTAQFDPVGVTAGSNLGVYQSGVAVISFDYDGTVSNDDTQYTNADGAPTIGQTLTFQAVGNNDRKYSMEATVIATSPDICKKGGWEAFDYKNQGQCIASIVANDNAEPHAGD